MSAPAAPPAAAPAAGAPPAPRRSRKPLILGLVLLALGGAGGFGAVRLGLPGGGESAAEGGAEAEPPPEIAPAAFVPLPAILVNLPGAGEGRFLRFLAQLEVEPAWAEEVAALEPRVVDVLNGYLRAVELAEIADPAALPRLRAQMLRRVQVVAGGDRVRDLLVMEFVVN